MKPSAVFPQSDPTGEVNQLLQIKVKECCFIVAQSLLVNIQLIATAFCSANWVANLPDDTVKVKRNISM